MKWFNNNIVFGLDIGNFNIKTVNHCFVTGYKDVGENSSFDDKLIFQNKSYTLSTDRIPIQADKTINEDFLILSLLAIGKEFSYYNIEEGYYDVVLSLGLPPEKLDAFSLRENLKKYYMNRGDICFQFNSKEYIINIVDVKVCPQCFAAVVPAISTDDMKLEKQKTGVLYARTPLDFVRNEPSCFLIDLGGGTVDVILLKDGRPSPEVHKSFDWGIVNIYNEINDQVSKNFEMPLSEDTINSILLGKQVRVSKEIVDFINLYVENYANDLIMRFAERKYELQTSYVIFIGGTSQILKKSLLNQSSKFGKLDFISDICANVKGFEELAILSLKKG